MNLSRSAGNETDTKKSKNIGEEKNYVSPVTCHVSPVTCHQHIVVCRERHPNSNIVYPKDPQIVPYPLATLKCSHA